MRQLCTRLGPIARTAAAVAAVALPWPVNAQPVPLGDEIVVNTYTTGAQTDPAVAADGAGRYVVVWTSAASSSGSSRSIRGQRYDAAGQPAGTEFEISAGVSSSSDASVAMQADGSFVVAWRAATPSIAARAFDENGQPRSSAFRVDSTVFTYENGYDHGYDDMKGPPKVAAASGGQFLVVWEGGYNEYLYFVHRHRRILGQQIDLDGNLSGSEFRVRGNFYYYALRPDVAADGDGRFVVVWSEISYYSYGYGGPDGNDYVREPHYRVTARGVDGSGTPTGTETAVGLDGERGPEVASQTSGRYIVVWPLGNSTDGVRLAARRHDASGSPLADPFVVSSPATSESGRTNAGADGSAIALAPNDSFTVAWSSGGSGYDGSSDGSATGLFARSYTSDGQAFGNEIAVNAHTSGAQSKPDGTFADDGTLVLVWQSDEQDGSGSAIVARRFARAPACGDASADGQTGASDALIVLSAVVGLRACPLCVCDADASAAVTVTDALRILRAATGQPSLLACAAC